MKKLLSRKFLAALGAIIGTVLVAHPNVAPYFIVGIAALYVVTEAILDRLGIQSVDIDSAPSLFASAPSTKVSVKGGTADSKPQDVVNAILQTLASPPSSAPPAPKTLPMTGLGPVVEVPIGQSVAPVTEPSPSPVEAAAQAAATVTALALVIFFGAVLFACAAVKQAAKDDAKEPAPCKQVELATIEANYQADILTKCKGFKFDSCPARAQIEADNAARREEWNRCH